MNLANLKNGQDFKNFCAGLKPSDIQSWTTHDWLEVYKSIDRCIINDDKYEFVEDFMEDNIAEFEKLYSNYRIEKKYAENLRQVAEKSADEVSQKYPQAKEDMKYIELNAVNSQVKERLTDKFIKSIYRNAYFDRFSQILLRPGIRVGRIFEEKTQGAYQSNKHRLIISNCRSQVVNTIIHEIYHSIQGIGPFLSKLQKLGKGHGYEDATMNTLNAYNCQYYYCISDSKNNDNIHNQYKAYSRQPIEYSARLFSALFERRLNANLNYSKEGITALKSVKMLLGDFNLTPESMLFDSKNNQIKICINDSRISHMELAYNLNKKYLKGSINNIDGKLNIEIPANYANVRRLQLIHRGLLQTYGDEKDYKKMFMNEFPETTKKYPSLYEEKAEAAKKRDALKNAKPRSRLPRVIRNIKDYLIER